ncbi:MAG: hypothetical protein LBM59_00835 [Ruminococcus sp.]|jgi:Zn finger protein HypA/HybF involved in hydrogenase expression|nr:hypothetical protein [Ruminococcus sp.]
MTENEKALEDVNGGKIEIETSYLPGWYTCLSCNWHKERVFGKELLTQCPQCGGDLFFRTNEKMTHYHG